jgi:hypothetical protein
VDRRHQRRGSNSGLLPEALQREGAPAGYMNLELDGNSYTETYRATGQPEDEQMTLSVNSPFFRAWYDTMAAWDKEQAKLTPRDRRAVPPVNLNDLGDLNLLSRGRPGRGLLPHSQRLERDTATEVTVQIDDEEPASRPHPAGEGRGDP